MWDKRLGFYFLVWYVASAVANSSSKQLLLQWPHPLELGCFQLFIGSICGYIWLRLSGIRTRLDPKNETLILLSLVNLIGFVCINIGFTLMHVSLAETLRAAEPISSLVLSYWMLKGSNEEQVSLKRTASLLPIVLGTGLSSAGSGEFSLSGVAICGVANLMFSLRAVLAKKYHKMNTHKKGNMYMFYCMNILGFCLQLCFICISNLFTFDGEPIPETPLDLNATAQDPEQMNWLSTEQGTILLLVNGISYFLYNQMSFLVLSKVHIITHGIGNVMRRVVTILVSILIFHNEISLLNVGGMVCAFAGVVFYSNVTAKEKAMVSLTNVRVSSATYMDKKSDYKEAEDVGRQRIQEHQYEYDVEEGAKKEKMKDLLDAFDDTM